MVPMHALTSKYKGSNDPSIQVRSGFVSLQSPRKPVLIDRSGTNMPSPFATADDVWQRIAHTIGAVVASAFQVHLAEMQAPTRGSAPVALARQVALYLVHVGYGLTFTRTGKLFGRDRTTVAHACRAVEERREDPDFDACLDYLEIAARLFIEWRIANHLLNGRV